MAAEPASEVSALWERVRKLLEEDELDEALELAERFVERAPGSGEARAIVGSVLAQRGETERALTFLEQALVLDPDLTVARLEKGRVLLDEGRFEDVPEALEGESSAEALYLVAAALYELGEHEEAEAACARALAVEELSRLRHLEALLRLQRGRSDEALVAAQRAIELDPDSPEGHHALGLAWTQLGQLAEADAAFARAAELDPDSYFLPARLSEAEFEELVDEALSTIPEEFEPFLENVEIAIEDVPDPASVREGLEFDLLGLYQGHTIQTASWDLPDRVLLYQRNLENISPDRETLIAEVRDTVYHEVGHHMGMDEDAVRAAEEDDFEDDELEEDEP